MADKIQQLDFFLTINDDRGVQVSLYRGAAKRVFGFAKNKEELTAIFCDAALQVGVREGEEVECGYICSSSIDFPDECTSDQALIDFCKTL